MIEDLFKRLPAREGHFVLESGYHTDLWLTLDALFASPRDLAPLIESLADKLRPYGPTAVCGPFEGGAFLAHALATQLGIDFYFSQPLPSSSSRALFQAEYQLPPELRQRVKGKRIALVDDVISAGSSVRATAAALADSNATIAVVGTLFVLGRIALEHFDRLGIPVASLGQRDFTTWEPSRCPLCRNGVPLEDLVHAGLSGARSNMSAATRDGTRLTSISPQFLVDNLDNSVTYYRDRLGFTLDFVYESFYAGVSRDGLSIHLKCAPKTLSDRAHRKQQEHLDAHIDVIDIEGLYEDLQSRGAQIVRRLEERPWAHKDFYVEDPDGYILCFSAQVTGV